MNSEHLTDQVLERVARRAAVGPAPLVAVLIKAWRSGFPDADPVEALACSPRTLSELALCRRARPDSWVEDVSEIAGNLGLDLDRLVAFLRAAEAVERFHGAHPADASQAGRLLAARDHDEER
jgi:hypothetical protein